MLYLKEKTGNPKRQTHKNVGAQSRAFRSSPQGLDRQTAEDSSFVAGFNPRQVLPGIFLISKEMLT